jgi:predicted  nucleic acid-binding Zn-ribbon protein
MEPGALPIWAQNAAMLAIAFVAAVLGVYRYLKTEAKTDTAATAVSSSVISASFIDSKLLKELIEAMRELQDEQGRDAKKSHRLSQDLREAVNELNESIIVQTDSTMNLVRFVNRRNRVVDPIEET